MSIGLPRGTVRIEPYNQEWAREFAREEAVLRQEFGDRIAGIEHIGSTSVPGLAAKPIIDIIMAVNSFDELADFIAPLQKLGYEYMPERMFADRKFFPKGPRENRTHHLNIVLAGDPEQWQQPIAFRDYLRTHATAREEYRRLKQRLAQEFPQDRAAYTQAKSDCIRGIHAKMNV